MRLVKVRGVKSGRLEKAQFRGISRLCQDTSLHTLIVQLANGKMTSPTYVLFSYEEEAWLRKRALRDWAIEGEPPMLAEELLRQILTRSRLPGEVVRVGTDPREPGNVLAIRFPPKGARK